jgi:hypothetical protein
MLALAAVQQQRQREAENSGEDRQQSPRKLQEGQLGEVLPDGCRQRDEQEGDKQSNYRESDGEFFISAYQVSSAEDEVAAISASASMLAV